VGTVQPRKNLERLIEAFARLKGAEAQRLKLVIAGKLGWLYDEILAAPEKYGVKEKIIFIGYTYDEEREMLLKNALLYVQPSITEGFGLPVLEAMAAGVPVVSSCGGALGEIAGKAAVLFDPCDTLSIISSLEMVVSSLQLRQKLVRKGRERVKNFSWEKAAKETLSLITNDHYLIV
jgi:glycosyltransferase involved in cell wall biosynthesis